jgi:N-acetylgalactosamine kinase
VAINRLPVHANLLVDLCGEGEWFVGTRGGSGDHAAIKFGTRGQVAHMSFLPFRMCGFVPFLEGHAVVVCNSGLQAKKSEGARETFNRRVLGYVAGEILFKQIYPQFADRIERLRDLTCQKLGVGLDQLYGMLKAIPVRITRRELHERYGPLPSEETEKLEVILRTLADPEAPFEVRGLMLFGLAECERSECCVEYLEQGDARGFGGLWYTSHDGDRVVAHDGELREVPWTYEVDDAYLDQLIGALQGGTPEQAARARLALQPGQYACSTPEIDRIVDLSRRVPGVKGAQMAGAGLGGCVMILVEDEACARSIEALRQHGLEAWRYHFVEGAGLVVL